MLSADVDDAVAADDAAYSVGDFSPVISLWLLAAADASCCWTEVPLLARGQTNGQRGKFANCNASCSTVFHCMDNHLKCPFTCALFLQPIA